MLKGLKELVYLSVDEVLDVHGQFLCQLLLLLIWDVQLLVSLDDIQVLQIDGELLVVSRSHELDGLA